jgi:hypothetical protein
MSRGHSLLGCCGRGSGGFHCVCGAWQICSRSAVPAVRSFIFVPDFWRQRCFVEAGFAHSMVCFGPGFGAVVQSFLCCVLVCLHRVGDTLSCSVTAVIEGIHQVRPIGLFVQTVRAIAVRMKGEGQGGYAGVRVGEASHPGPANSGAAAYSSLDDVPMCVRHTFVHVDVPSPHRSVRRVASDHAGQHDGNDIAQKFFALDVQDHTVGAARQDDALEDTVSNETRRVRPRTEPCYCPVPGCPAGDPVRAVGWQSFDAMRPHLEEHLGGRLPLMCRPLVALSLMGSLPLSKFVRHVCQSRAMCLKVLSTCGFSASPLFSSLREGTGEPARIHVHDLWALLNPSGEGSSLFWSRASWPYHRLCLTTSRTEEVAFCERTLCERFSHVEARVEIRLP